jgi:hypothetical protein
MCESKKMQWQRNGWEPKDPARLLHFRLALLQAWLRSNFAKNDTYHPAYHHQ